MIRNSSIALVLLALTALITGCSSPAKQGMDLGDPASISNARPSASSTSGSGLELSTRPLKSAVEFGEPVYLALQLTNSGKESRKIVGDLRPGEGLMEITIATNDEKAVIFAPLSESDFETTFMLEPGQTIGSSFPIFFGANGWSFKEPGKYQVSTRLQVPGNGSFQYFDSKPVEFEVTASGAGHLLFESDINTSFETGKFLLWRSGDQLKKGMSHLQAVMKKAPDSILVSYISAAFANNLSEPFSNYLAGEVRPANCSQADKYRSQIKYNELPANLLIEDAMSRANCYAKVKKWDATLSELDRGLDIAGTNPEFAGYAKALDYMKGNLKQYLEN